MSDRRRAVRNQAAPPATSDQKVWGPSDTVAGSYGGAFDNSGGRGGYGAATPGRGAYTPDYASSPGYAPPAPDGRGDRSYGDDAPRGRRDNRAADLSPGRGTYGDDFNQDDAPKRRRRRRGSEDEPAYDSEQTVAYGGGARGGRGARGAEGYAEDYTGPTAPRRAPGGGHVPPDVPHDDEPRLRGRGGGGKRGLSVAGWISVVLTSLMVLGTLTAYKFYRDTFGLFNRGASTDDLDKNRPENQTGAINVLLVGSDTRAGDNKKYGQRLVNDGERTDTIMLLHVSPNRDGATLISFPRDSMVTIPKCYSKTGATVPPHLGMINSAFSDGGMICTRRTIESLTNIRIDHYVKVDFTGFKNIVNALGGIQICLPQDVNDRQSKFNLTKGKHVVMGETALAYVRLRHNIGDGSDIGRIKRQQVFISQVVKKATSSALLTDIPKLTGFITAAAKSVTMDDALNTEALIQIAQSASKLSAKGFKATTVPWIPDPANPQARVVWKQPDANNLFAGINGDTQVTPSATPSTATSGGTTSATPTKPAGPAITEPQQVKVEVYNGTNTSGRGREVAEALAAQGFKVVGVGDARKADGTDQPKTMIRYTGQGWDYAKLLAGKLLIPVSPETGKAASGPAQPFTPTSPPPDAPKGRVPGPVIQLVVGADWKGVRIPLQVGDNAVTSETNICAS
ncbi:LCP family protein [Planotetraspora sp. A-T 1434]|uniref:LCP family protein n=1 Tax=Planotetraspora sp. A-T 1434 TaxID=2979219 RepID=UPI0021C18353|nr:LCP family protein [Planotetraspora sp. A-T 1434]MCT9928809.1 LCP family protein [Planotetraspora sp. A-T 1434]